MSKKHGKTWDFIIIGAGASGMMAAVTAARAGAHVLILEQKDRIGKKLLATGNGKCNFTNEDMKLIHFHGDRELIAEVLSQFTVKDTISFFHGLGILPKNKNGYYYPNSGQALSMLSAFRTELERRGVTVRTGAAVTGIRAASYGFLVETKEESYHGRKVLLATGLLAAPKLGSDGSAFSVIKELGHRFTPIVPALCGFYCEGCDFSGWSGVRTDAKVTVYIDGKTAASDTGELQLTDYGISGIPVFQVSRFASLALKEKRKVQASLHFLPDMTESDIHNELDFRLHNFDGAEPLEQLLNGLLHQKLIPAVLKKAGIPLGKTVREWTPEYGRSLVSAITDFTINMKRARDYEFAQVCAGGIRSGEVDFHTLESKLVPGLYFSGELLDADGICGGYNLQWAWSSGYVAGIHAVSHKKEAL